MKKIIALICLIPLLGYSQSNDNFGIKFSGFVKNDFFGDSHEYTAIREGHFLLYPTNDLIDSRGAIVNNEPTFNFLSIQTRLVGKITGPDAFGAKTSGLIEADFFGNENTNLADVNGFRLRHATAKLNWTNTEVMTGQFWHPLFVTDCFPGVVSFNTGAPFQPFSRNPQIRITQMVENIRLIAAINSQRDFTNTGGSTELRNSSIPDMNAQLHFTHKDDSTLTEYVFGGGIEYKIVNPRFTNTVNGALFKVHERVNSMALMAFAKYQTKTFSVKAQGIYGQNLTDHVMLGGYVLQEVDNQVTGESIYSPLNNMAGWIDLAYKYKKFEFGVFGGYTQNLGAKEDIIKASLSAKTRGYNIHNIYRVAPRVVLTTGKLKLAGEIEYTAAAYATKKPDGTLNIDDKGVVTDSKYVNNTRFLLSVIYNF